VFRVSRVVTRSLRDLHRNVAIAWLFAGRVGVGDSCPALA
jgi:hypothetical protein